MATNYEPVRTEEASDILKRRGWDKGFVVFGAAMSESTVKILSAAKLLTSRADDFGFPYKEFTFVAMDFNDKDTWTPDGKGTLGVWSPAWRAISSNGPMPGYALDGSFYMDTKLMLSFLFATYKDQTLSSAEQMEVGDWIALNEKWQDSVMQAALHWGWSGFHGRVKDIPQDRFEKAYAMYGKGKKDREWEKQKIKDVNTFLGTIESRIQEPITGYLVAGKTTLADCVMANWYHTLYDIANLQIEKRYPKVAKHYKKQDALKLPEGAVDHQSMFSMFGKFIHVVNTCGGDRGCCGVHDINDTKLWEEVV